MQKEKKLVIIGDGEFAEIAYEYFTYDSNYQVIGFLVEKEYKIKDELMGLPVYHYEDIEDLYSKNDIELFVAITFTKFNRIRTRLYKDAKARGYEFATYISSNAFVWHNVEIGENCFIFENNVIQHKAVIGNNVILWSGNHIGHRTVIHDNCFISSHVVISGWCKIGKNNFLGVNSSFNDEIETDEDVIVGSGAVVVKNCIRGKIYVGNPAKALVKSSYDRFELNISTE